MVSGRSIPSREQGTTLRAVILLTLLISLGTSCAANRAYSDPVREEVADSLFIPVDGARLYLLVRGQRRDAPILIWLDGGPGGAERPLYRRTGSIQLCRDRLLVVRSNQRRASLRF